ncbi:MAG: hypothetical protein LBE91_03060 [Tannerella sp.]|jgi:hypothetical protein|nr:hypothetical protein [Tannerella sp.]
MMAVTYVLTQKENPGNSEVRKDKVKSRRAFQKRTDGKFQKHACDFRKAGGLFGRKPDAMTYLVLSEVRQYRFGNTKYALHERRKIIDNLEVV